MKNIVIIGAGTAGTIVLNKLNKVLNKKEYKLTIIDKEDIHYYQPGFLFIPFGYYTKSDVEKNKLQFIPKGVDTIFSNVKRIAAEQNKIEFFNGRDLFYDYLIISTGTKIAPEETKGLNGELWYKNIFDFYTLEGALQLHKFLENWKGGKLVINITEMPIKCPVAPIEFTFLADDYFKKKGIREKVDIHYVTPLPDVFTKSIASKMLSAFLSKKNIKITTEYNIARVDNINKKIISWDDIEIPFDLLVSIPTNKGDELIERSQLGDELNFIPTDKYTLQSISYKNIFVVGDASDIPVSKAGSTSHFQSEIVVKNLLNLINNKSLEKTFDGHANCYLESGNKKAFLIDFNYDVEPLPGKFPFPVIGPFSLLKETRINHWGKLFFKWIYWHLLLRGRYIPISNRMSMAGKKINILKMGGTK